MGDDIAAASGAQRGLEAHPWPDIAGLRVCTATHTGEPSAGPADFVASTELVFGLSVERLTIRHDACATPSRMWPR